MTLRFPQVPAQSNPQESQNSSGERVGPLPAGIQGAANQTTTPGLGQGVGISSTPEALQRAQELFSGPLPSFNSFEGIDEVIRRAAETIGVSQWTSFVATRAPLDLDTGNLSFSRQNLDVIRGVDRKEGVLLGNFDFSPDGSNALAAFELMMTAAFVNLKRGLEDALPELGGSLFLLDGLTPEENRIRLALGKLALEFNTALLSLDDVLRAPWSLEQSVPTTGWLLRRSPGYPLTLSNREVERVLAGFIGEIDQSPAQVWNRWTRESAWAMAWGTSPALDLTPEQREEKFKILLGTAGAPLPFPATVQGWDDLVASVPSPAPPSVAPAVQGTLAQLPEATQQTGVLDRILTQEEREPIAQRIRGAAFGLEPTFDVWTGSGTTDAVARRASQIAGFFNVFQPTEKQLLFALTTIVRNSLLLREASNAGFPNKTLLPDEDQASALGENRGFESFPFTLMGGSGLVPSRSPKRAPLLTVDGRTLNVWASEEARNLIRDDLLGDTLDPITTKAWRSEVRLRLASGSEWASQARASLPADLISGSLSKIVKNHNENVVLAKLNQLRSEELASVRSQIPSLRETADQVQGQIDALTSAREQHEAAIEAERAARAKVQEQLQRLFGIAPRLSDDYFEEDPRSESRFGVAGLARFQYQKYQRRVGNLITSLVYYREPKTYEFKLQIIFWDGTGQSGSRFPTDPYNPSRRAQAIDKARDIFEVARNDLNRPSVGSALQRLEEARRDLAASWQVIKGTDTAAILRDAASVEGEFENIRAAEREIAQRFSAAPTLLRDEVGRRLLAHWIALNSEPNSLQQAELLGASCLLSFFEWSGSSEVLARLGTDKISVYNQALETSILGLAKGSQQEVPPEEGSFKFDLGATAGEHSFLSASGEGFINTSKYLGQIVGPLYESIINSGPLRTEPAAGFPVGSTVWLGFDAFTLWSMCCALVLGAIRESDVRASSIQAEPHRSVVLSVLPDGRAELICDESQIAALAVPSSLLDDLGDWAKESSGALEAIPAFHALVWNNLNQRLDPVIRSLDSTQPLEPEAALETLLSGAPNLAALWALGGNGRLAASGIVPKALQITSENTQDAPGALQALRKGVDSGALKNGFVRLLVALLKEVGFGDLYQPTASGNGEIDTDRILLFGATRRNQRNRALEVTMLWESLLDDFAFSKFWTLRMDLWAVPKRQDILLSPVEFDSEGLPVLRRQVDGGQVITRLSTIQQMFDQWWVFKTVVDGETRTMNWRQASEFVGDEGIDFPPALLNEALNACLRLWLRALWGLAVDDTLTSKALNYGEELQDFAIRNASEQPFERIYCLPWTKDFARATTNDDQSLAFPRGVGAWGLNPSAAERVERQIGSAISAGELRLTWSDYDS